jgi:thiosulfate dehydrogenase [quinone] large subunit
MTSSRFERVLILFFRVAMGWTFLYAGLSQVTNPHFTVAAFLAGTKTFHDQLAWFALPAIAPYMTFLVEWGHLLIGLSLIFGCMIRVGAPFGVLLMAIYYCAHMDWPYVESQVNFIMDYHLVYGGVLIYLVAKHAGHVWGLDGLLERIPAIAQRSALRPLFQ